MLFGDALLIQKHSNPSRVQQWQSGGTQALLKINPLKPEPSKLPRP
jgi:hypothetical protein